MKKCFICASEKYNGRYNHVSAPLFKKVFDWNGGKDNIIIRIAVCGIYRLFLNGKEITKGFFAPYLANPDQAVYYDEYFIGEYLQEKDNVLCVLLGNGFNNAIDCGIWDFEKASFRSSPKFSLEILNEQGKVFSSDETFSWIESPIIFDDMRCGEFYDANIEFDIFTSNTDNYKKAICATAPKGILKKCEVESIRAFEKLKPIKIIKINNGYIYDFGSNNGATFILNITAKQGQKIDFYCAETLRDGDLLMETVSFIDRWDLNYIHQHDSYICKEGDQTYMPTMTYHGFQYIRVEGIHEEQATSDLLTAVVLHSDLKRRGTFRTDNEIINKIQECVMRSNYSNLFYFPTDCPHREKNGWTDDANFSAEQMNYNLNVYDTLREWLYNIRLSQKSTGVIPGIIPTTGWGYMWGNGPMSDAVIVELPYQLYRFSGKKDVLEENAEAIKRYIDYVKLQENSDGLFNYGIGDWCEAGSYNEFSMATPGEICDTLTVLQIIVTAERIYRILEKNEWAKEMQKFYQKVRDNFRTKYCKEKGWIDCKTQTAQAMGLVLGVFNEDEIALAYSNLVQRIHENGNVMKVGVVGVKYLFDILAKNGDVDLAFELITTEKWPSYGNLVRLGATTLWEMFQHVDCLENFKPYDCDGRALSLNHHFWGCISAWFYRELGGLNLVTHNYIELSPKFPSALTFVETTFETETGKISVYWEKEGVALRLKIQNKGFNGEIKINGYSLPNNVKLQEGITEYVLLKS